MDSIGSRCLNLLMAFVAAITLTLPARARVCGAISLFPATGPSAPGQTGFKSSRQPAPAQVPLCHVRCRGFVASVPAPSVQHHEAAPAALETVAVRLLPAPTEVLARRTVTSSRGDSPPLFTVLRL